MTPGGPADEAGLRVNDKLLSVNNISCVNVDHYEAVGILKVCIYHCSKDPKQKYIFNSISTISFRDTNNLLHLYQSEQLEM